MHIAYKNKENKKNRNNMKNGKIKRDLKFVYKYVFNLSNVIK